MAASLNQLANVTIPTRRRLLQTGRWIPVAQLIGKHTVNKEIMGILLVLLSYGSTVLRNPKQEGWSAMHILQICPTMSQLSGCDLYRECPLWLTLPQARHFRFLAAPLCLRQADRATICLKTPKETAMPTSRICSIVKDS